MNTIINILSTLFEIMPVLLFIFFRKVEGPASIKNQRLVPGCTSQTSLEMLIFDGVDINKNTVKKMEELKTVRDATQKTYGNGYVLHGVSMKGIPLFLHRERKKKDGTDTTIRMDMFVSQIFTQN